MSQVERFETWALVEVMGHKQLAGLVSETTVAGAGMVRVDVPEVPSLSSGSTSRLRPGGQTCSDQPALPGFTKLLSPAAIYGITPLDEQVARQLAASLRERPVEAWRLDTSRALPPARQCQVAEEVPDEDEDFASQDELPVDDGDGHDPFSPGLDD